MEILSQVVQKYLIANGIEAKFFADYIGCGRTKCSLWFKGEKRLSPEQLRKTHEFLAGKHLKSLDKIMNNGEG